MMVLKTRVEHTSNETANQRVFVRFADKDAKERATKVLHAAQQEAPVGKGPNAGTLRRMLTMSQSRDTRGRWASGYDVTSNAPYSVYVIKPTRPHVIRGNPLLGFFWPKLGRFVVFHSVNHPGTRGNDFMSRALRKAR